MTQQPDIEPWPPVLQVSDHVMFNLADQVSVFMTPQSEGRPATPLGTE
jgi:hypothetical protein